MSERLTDADIAAIAVSGHDGRAHAVPRWAYAVPRWACRSLAAEVQASRKLIADLRALHQPMWFSEQAKAAGKEPWVCELCGTGDGSWPCESVLLIDEAGL